jgi:hypothetical protein
LSDDSSNHTPSTICNVLDFGFAIVQLLYNGMMLVAVSKEWLTSNLRRLCASGLFSMGWTLNLHYLSWEWMKLHKDTFLKWALEVCSVGI